MCVRRGTFCTLTLLSKYSCFVKTGVRFFQILWPSHNVLTLESGSIGCGVTSLWFMKFGKIFGLKVGRIKGNFDLI